MHTAFKTIALLAMLALGTTLFAGLAMAGQPQTKCPVMGYPINKKLHADYNGKRVYFCCESCPETFKKDPATYIKKLEDQGVELEKTPAQ